ncbi:MAG: Ig-like domain-containing protein [Spirochaetaceae bacterium]|jgi:hypothetical protein|nr:Ig-like domain-containing protein [Spirochaetaceae bacterium]
MNRRTKKSSLPAHNGTTNRGRFWFVFFCLIAAAAAVFIGSCDHYSLQEYLEDRYFVPVTDITLTCASAVLPGKSLTLTCPVQPGDATNKAVTWTVSDHGGTGAVITGGVFTAADVGTAVITARIANGLWRGKDFVKAFTITVTEFPFSIGDTGPAGGIIFYMDVEGFTVNGVTCHYLEAAPEDVPGTYTWGEYGIDCSTETLVGTGAANTAALTAADHGHDHPAAKACADYSYGGWDDWFLPSKDEMNLHLYPNRDIIGSFGADYWYWSSSQYGDYDAWVRDFNGEMWNELKSSEHHCRAVRAF